MNLLAIDTSTSRASVALYVGEVFTELKQDSLKQHAQTLLPLVNQLLQAQQISFNQLDGIVFGRGPGSFTGLRITCSIAKALAYAHDLPLFPVSSLASIAYDAQHQFDNPLSVLSVLDARMQQLYWGFYLPQYYQTEECVTDAKDINPKCADDRQEIILAGVDFESYLPNISPQWLARLKHHLSLYPSAKTMIKIVLSGQIDPVSAVNAQPVYIRNQVTQGANHG